MNFTLDSPRVLRIAVEDDTASLYTVASHLSMMIVSGSGYLSKSQGDKSDQEKKRQKERKAKGP